MIDIAHSGNPDAGEACAEIAAALQPAGMEMLLFFCSSFYDLDALADALKRNFPDVPAIGCTTAGEIAPSGYGSRGIVAISFPKDDVKTQTLRLEHLHQFDPAASLEQAHAVVRTFEESSAASPANTFALMLIDGLSQREEQVTRVLQRALGGIALFGGSAGDDLRFEKTWVFHDGRFHRDAAVVALISTSLPFKVFKTQHFVRGDEKLVVTEAEPATRTIREINGRPAAEEYARIIGATVAALDAACFAAHPVVVRIGGVDFVRSIQKANPDGSLTFYCAIDEGIILTVAKGMNPVENLRATLEDLGKELGPPQIVLVCDCILRNLEFQQTEQTDLLGQIFNDYHVVGFSTYGEQFCGIHINQTLTGIAIGHSRKDSHA